MAPSLKFKLSHEMIRYTLVLKKKNVFSCYPHFWLPSNTLNMTTFLGVLTFENNVCSDK